MKRRRESKEARRTKYYIRAIKRIIRLVFWLVLLFLIVMGLIYIVPKIWTFVFG